MQQLKKLSTLILCCLAFISLLLSIAHCTNKLSYIAAMEKTSGTPQFYTDFNFYVDAGKQYQETKQLYKRPAQGETFASTYYPMAPVFKFPPAFQLQILPFVNHWTPETLRPLRTSMIISYLAACLILITSICLTMNKHQQPITNIFLVFTLSSVIATSNPAFWDCILNANYEIPIFVFLTLSFFLLRKHPRLSATTIGYLAATKIYPAFMAALLLRTPTIKKTIPTFLLSTLLFSLIALALFGIDENIFYAKNIFTLLFQEKVAPVQFSLSFGSELFRLTQNLNFAQIAFQFYRFILLGISLLITIKYRSASHDISFFALFITLMLICIPNYWLSYLIMLFPAFCIAIYRVIARPTSLGVSALLLCAGAILIESQSWLHIYAPTWFKDINQLDETGNKILTAIQQDKTTKASLIFLQHYPLTAALYFFEQIKFVIPAMLWAFVAREITSPAYRVAQPTSSNPER